MDLTHGWTGETACALQSALRLSNEAFAERLGIGVRTVAGWHQKPELRQKSEIQQVLDTALDKASPAAKERFAALTSAPTATSDPDDDATADAEHRLTADPNIGAALDWLDQHAAWEPGTARRRVAAQVARVDVRQLQDRGSRRGRVDQRTTAGALKTYYGQVSGDHGRYSAHYSDSEITTSVLTHPDWLDLDCPLIARHDRLSVTRTSADADVSLDEQAAQRAVERLAETLALGVRLIDMPLYRLLDPDIRQGHSGGSAGVTRFVGYALTMDLLENELVDALAAGVDPQCGSLPLRDRYLPDLASVLDVGAQLCAGGSLALCATARPASPFRGRRIIFSWCKSAPATSSTRRDDSPSSRRAFTSR